MKKMVVVFFNDLGVQQLGLDKNVKRYDNIRRVIDDLDHVILNSNDPATPHVVHKYEHITQYQVLPVAG